MPTPMPKTFETTAADLPGQEPLNGAAGVGVRCIELLEQKVQTALARMTDAIERFDPAMVVGLFSGGHDSLSANYVASLHPRFNGCLHVNTGIGIERTRQFVRDTCATRGWLLWEYKAVENCLSDGTPDPMDYDQIVLANGFPGPAAHRYFYVKLKDRCIQRFLRDMGATENRRVLFISGARTEESQRRMGNTRPEPSEYGRSVWLNAIHDWTKLNTTEVLERAGLERNPVVDLIHKSGECLCGAFKKPGELEELNQWDITRPTYDRIIALQARVRAAGFPWGWGDRPPEWYQEKKYGQEFLLDYDCPEAWEQPMCWSCNKHEMSVL